MPQHLNQIWAWTLTWPLQNIFLFFQKKKKKIVFLSHSEGDILVCFGSLSCCITQVPLSSQTDGRTISFRIFWKSAEFMVPSIMASCPGPEGLSHYHHHVWLLVWCSFYEMLCWFYTWYNGTQTFQKVKLLSHQSTKYLPTSLGYNQDVLFWLMWDESLCTFWSAVAFTLELSHECCFCPVSFLLLNHEH